MTRSIVDFFSVPWNEFFVNREVTFDIYLKFSQSHIILFRRRGSLINQELIDRYYAKGLKMVWLHNSHRQEYDLYRQGLNTKEVERELGRTAAEIDLDKINAEAVQTLENESEKGGDAFPSESEATASPPWNGGGLPTPEQATEILAMIDEDNDKARDYAGKLLGGSENKTIRELFRVSETMREDMGHSLELCTYTVLIALIFGEDDPHALEDLAVTALAHEVSRCWLPMQLAWTPWTLLSQAERDQYVLHVKTGLEWIEGRGQTLTAGQIQLIRHYRNHFGGTGVLKKEMSEFKGSVSSDLLTFLTLADWIVCITNGRWDDQVRIVSDSIDLIYSQKDDCDFDFDFEKLKVVKEKIRMKKRSDLVNQSQQIATDQLTAVLKVGG